MLLGGSWLNLASTVASAFIVTVHGLAAPQPPPVKVVHDEPAARGRTQRDCGAVRDPLRAVCVSGAAAVDAAARDRA
jgi:hypothetical protein